MSYCRWSTDDFMCDLYCYQSGDDEYITHVAGNRAIFRPLPAPSFNLLKKRFGWRRLKIRSWLHSFSMKLIPRRNIGLPHDGETLRADGLDDFLDQLLYLRGLGYRFPYAVVERVEQEIAERDAEVCQNGQQSTTESVNVP